MKISITVLILTWFIWGQVQATTPIKQQTDQLAEIKKLYRSDWFAATIEGNKLIDQRRVKSTSFFNGKETGSRVNVVEDSNLWTHWSDPKTILQTKSKVSGNKVNIILERSVDGGRTWSTCRELGKFELTPEEVSGQRDPNVKKYEFLPNGRGEILMYPQRTEPGETTLSAAEISDKTCKTWRKIEPVNANSKIALPVDLIPWVFSDNRWFAVKVDSRKNDHVTKFESIYESFDGNLWKSVASPAGATVDNCGVFNAQPALTNLTTFVKKKDPKQKVISIFRAQGKAMFAIAGIVDWMDVSNQNVLYSSDSGTTWKSLSLETMQKQTCFSGFTGDGDEIVCPIDIQYSASCKSSDVYFFKNLILFKYTVGETSAQFLSTLDTNPLVQELKKHHFDPLVSGVRVFHEKGKAHLLFTMQPKLEVETD